MNEPSTSDTSVTETDVEVSHAVTAEHHDSKNIHTKTVSFDTPSVEPREHRRPNRPGIVWAAGSRLEARDFLKKWYILVSSSLTSAQYF